MDPTHPREPSNHPQHRPFSYQIPPDEPREPHAAQGDAQSQTATTPNSRRIPPHTQPIEVPYDERAWAGYPQQRFSYVETPIEDSTQDFDSLPQPTQAQPQNQQETIPQHLTHPDPQYDESRIQYAPSPAPPSSDQYPTDKPVPQRMPSAYQRPPPSQPHPATFASTAPTNDFDPSDPTKLPASPHSPGPIPFKAPNADDDPRPPQFSPPKNTRSPHPPEAAYTSAAPTFSPPPGHASSHISSPTTAASAASAANPNTAPFSPFAPDIASTHRPGQVPHPNMTNGATKPADSSDAAGGRNWLFSLCACPAADISTCLLGLGCPCVLYSRLLHRLAQRSRKRDPTDLLGFEKCNGHCLAFATLCLCGGVGSGLLSCVALGRVRRTYGVRGSWAGDLGKGVCCCCCTVVQGEREVRGREEERGRWAGPAVDIGAGGVGAGVGGGAEQYERREGMRYEPDSGRR